MGNAYLSNAGTFLIQTIFGLVMLVFMLRFIMQLVRADFYNPVSAFIVKVTTPVLRPLRKFIPGLLGLDMASIVVLLVLQVLELFLITALMGVSLSPLGLTVLSLAELLDLALKVFLFSIFIQVIISWVNPGSYNPVIGVLHSITEPLLRPARRLLPPIHGFDLSPIIVIVGLQLVSMLVIAPISDFGRSLG